ncbi:MAG TPA: lysophospholipid acyltransferase family protein [Acidimicrobiales bacterium]|nr:lysophospholipid acyltransferase family protein [Acidimicrobiales bacterium]
MPASDGRGPTPTPVRRHGSPRTRSSDRLPHPSQDTRSPDDADRAHGALVPLRPRTGPPEAAEPLDEGVRKSDVDPWGRSESARKLISRLTGIYYDYWFRVEWEGLEKIPREGGALLVSNHAGAIPSDAPMIMHGIEKEVGRPVYGLADYWFKAMPFVGTGWARSGGVAAHPDNAHRLLHDEQQLALVFPEGTKGTSKLYRDRYQLRRFGRGGFVETAMRAGVPVIPIAVVGAEESMPILTRLPSGIANRLGVPYLPLTLNHLLLGPVVGSVVWLPAKMRIRVLDPVEFGVAPNLERYPRSRVMEEAEAIRLSLQDNLHSMLRHRKSPWFG